MIFAIKALKKSLLLIIQNFRAALLLTGSLYLLYALLIALSSFVFTGSFSMEVKLFDASAPDGSGLTSVDLLHGLVAMIVGVILFALMAILWHRFILIDEKSDAPPISASLVFHYIFQSIIVGILVALAMIPFVIVVSPFGLISLMLFQFLAIAVLSIAGFWLVQRFSMVLPAVAIGDSSVGKRMWSHTSVISFELFFMGVLFTVFSLAAVALLDVVIEAIGGQVAFVFSHVFSWLGFLINVSILTTLYGHLFQDRSLD